MRKSVVLGLLVVLVAACTSNPPRRMDPIEAPSRLAAEALPELEAMAMALPAMFLPAKSLDEIRIHSLPIGAGSCHVVECPGNTSPIVYDCGTLGGGPRSWSEQETVEYVQAILDDYSNPPILVVSHPDQDHYNLLPEVLDGHDPVRIWLGGLLADYRQDGFDVWLQAKRAAGVPLQVGLGGLPAGFNNGGAEVADLDCGDGATFVMTVNSGNGTNPRSMVVRVEHGSFSAILAGDATQVTEIAAMTFPRTQTTLLTGSHHGASTHGSNHADWASATKPQVTVFSAGAKHKHPKCSSMLAYKSHLDAAPAHLIRCGKRMGGYTRDFWVDEAEYVTEVSGAVVVTSDSSGEWSVKCSEDPHCG